MYNWQIKRYLIERGSRNVLFSYLKNFLVSQPYIKIKPNREAVFDASLQSALADFQRYHRLSSVDGMLNEETYKALGREMSNYELERLCSVDSLLWLLTNNGGGLLFGNELAQKRIREVLSPGLTATELQNIRFMLKRLVLREPKAINLEQSSPAYRYLSQLIEDKTTFYYYAVDKGQSVTTIDGLTVAYADLYGQSAGLTSGKFGDSLRSVVVPVGGSTPVKAMPKGSGKTTSFPEDVIFAHEAYGHGLHADDSDVIRVENEYRRSRNPPLVERSGEDHQFEVNIESNTQQELIDPPNIPLNTNITPQPLKSLPNNP